MPNIEDIGGECLDSQDGYHVYDDAGVCVYCGYDKHEAGGGTPNNN